MWLHAAYAFICGSAPARLGDAGPGLRAAPQCCVRRPRSVRRAGVGIWPECHRERARVGTWVRAELKLLTTLVRRRCGVCVRGARSLCST